MSTIRRDFLSSPHRTGTETWEAIAALLAPDANSAARKEILSVTATAAQIISTESAKDFPIISSGSGDRVRIYCLYNEDATDSDNGKEKALAFDATAKNWKISIPAEEEDLAWSKAELAKHTNRITVREKNEQLDDEDQTTNASASLKFDLEEFLKS
jgi:hypothetical protein